jgi:uncharacterized membrane protein YccC
MPRKSKFRALHRLEVNDVDEYIRRHHGTTVALEMSASRMHQSKRKENIIQNIHYLLHTNGELRTELLFYRQCYAESERFRHEVEMQAQELLHECITSNFQEPDMEKIRSISNEMDSSQERFHDRRDRAFKTFVVQHHDHQQKTLPGVDRDHQRSGVVCDSTSLTPGPVQSLRTASSSGMPT